MHKPKLLWRERPSDSPFIESVWSCAASVDISRTILADPCISFMLVSHKSKMRVFLAGPTTKPQTIRLGGGYSCVTIRLKPGVFLKNLPAQNLTNSSLSFQVDSKSRFWLEDMHLEFPSYGTVERLIEQLVQMKFIDYEAPMHDHTQTINNISSRTYARKVRRLTGFSPYQLYQIQRIYHAFRLLKQGMSAADVAAELAFVDQSHLVRASKQFFGHTPKQLAELPQEP